MDNSEIFGRSRRALDAWNCNSAASGLLQEKIGGMDGSAGRRQRVQEPNGQSELVHLCTKLLTIRSIPGDDRVKRPHSSHEVRRRIDALQTHPIDTRGGYGSHAIGETDQRCGFGADPDLGIFRAEAFQRRQRQNAIADRARSNQQTPQSRAISPARWFQTAGRPYPECSHEWLSRLPGPVS